MMNARKMLLVYIVVTDLVIGLHLEFVLNVKMTNQILLFLVAVNAHPLDYQLVKLSSYLIPEEMLKSMRN